MSDLPTMVELLEDEGILEDIRERTEWSDEKINTTTPFELVKEWCAWELGDEGSFWETAYLHFKRLSDERSSVYERIVQLEKESADNPNLMMTYKVLWDQLKEEQRSGVRR